MKSRTAVLVAALALGLGLCLAQGLWAETEHQRALSCLAAVACLAGLGLWAAAGPARGGGGLPAGEEWFATTLNSIGDAVLATDSRGRVAFLNPVAQKLTGFSAEEARGLPLAEVFRIFSAATGRPAEDPVARVLATGQVVGLANHTELVAKDGSRRQIADSAAPILDAKGRTRGVVLVFRDVTEEYRRAERLRLSEEKFAKAFQTSPYAITITRARDGKLLEVNDAFSTISGYSREEVLSQSSIALGLWEDNEARARVVAEAVAGGRVVGREFRYRAKDGRAIVGSFSATALVIGGEACVLSSIEDITERVRVRQEAEKGRQRLEAILAAAADPLVVYDSRGRATFVNPAFTRVFGWEPGEVLGRRPAYVPPEEEEATGQTIGRLFESGEPAALQTRRLTKDGRLLEVAINAAPIPGEDGQPEGMVVNLTDLTHLRELETQLRQAQKMEAVGTLAGGVAHDLNNLLSPIIGFSEMVLEDLARGEDRKEAVAQVHRAGVRARELVRQLLAFSRKQALRMQALDASQVARGLEGLLRRTIREDVEIVMNLQPDPRPVHADAGQLEQVIMNLTVNAQDAMPHGGRLTIETREVELDGAYAARHHDVRPGRYLMLAVSDQGEGMDQKTLGRAFEPFFTTKAKGRGTGLGLATVYGIVKQHGGHVWVYSEPGRGTSFKVYLPLAEDAAAAEEPPAEAPGRVAGDETVLLVEDEEMVRELAVTVLERHGYTVLAPEGAGQAEAAAGAHSGPIHLILTDVVMPGINGKELARRVRRDHPEARVLYMSGYTDNVIAHHGVLDEGVNFIQKPFTVKALAAQVRRVLDQPPPGAAGDQS